MQAKEVLRIYFTLKIPLKFRSKMNSRMQERIKNHENFTENSIFEVQKPKKGCSKRLMFFVVLMGIWVLDPHFAWSKTVDLEGNAQRCSPLSFD
jgi:hypothetical protein